MKNTARPDYILLLILAALLTIGFIMVFSTSPTLGLKLGDSFFYLRRHLMYLFFGSIALILGIRTDHRIYRKWALPAFLCATALLALVFVPGMGRSMGGAVRWLDLVIFSFQPSELAKIATVIFLASILSSWGGEENKTIRVLSASLIPVAAATLLVLGQPDLGTAIVIAGTTFVILAVAGISSKYLYSLAGTGLVALTILSVTSAYRFRRLIAFLNPWDSPYGVGFHIIQSLLAIGSGGIFGVGLGASRQKFFYLPQNYTDFIFSILSEELGLLGALSVIFLFSVFASRGIRIARRAPDVFGRLLATGIVAWIGIQAIINLCVVTGIFPTTGIPLPFISFGGTALVVSLFAVGVLVNISKSSPLSEGTKR